jgi:thiamine-monophosphate kinase
MQLAAPEIRIMDSNGKALDAQEAGLLLKSFDHFA